MDIVEQAIYGFCGELAQNIMVLLAQDVVVYAIAIANAIQAL